MENNIGLIIKALREKFDYTQDNVADYLNVKRELISFYESGEREASVDVLEKLSDLFGIELEVFFTENVDEALAEVAFAFRKDDLSATDMKQLATFGKIVKNYLKIKKLHECAE